MQEHRPPRGAAAGRRLACLLVVALLAACAPARGPSTFTPAVPAATENASPHAPLIRMALVGSVAEANVWALFDSAGYSYNNYAIRRDYWPRLYQLSIPNGDFQPQAAAAQPSPVEAEGAFFTATVPLRSNLKWTDGTPFTADDVVFTVSEALSFQLGFDWQAHYDPAVLDHAQALDAHTVKFYFVRAPDIAAWQYGALLGPIVQKAYWAPKIAEAAAMLPSQDSIAQIDSLQAQSETLQKAVNDIVQAGVTATGEQAHELQVELKRKQGDLDKTNNDLAKVQTAVDEARQAGRQALYAVADSKEPTLGTWMPAGSENGAWINSANPSHPFGMPSFDSAAYTLYPDAEAALAALNRGDADLILGPEGLPVDSTSNIVEQATLATNTTSSAHFLVINPSRGGLMNSELHRALFCAIDRNALAKSLGAAALSSFVPAEDAAWWNPEAVTSCGEGYDPSAGFDVTRAISILKSAGYTWAIEPSATQAGSGLTRPNGQLFPPIALLAPPADVDPQAAAAAQFVQASARYLGIPLSAQSASPSDIRYAVFNDHKYDIAIVGWRLSRYPGYLCEWFGDGNPFGLSNDTIHSACQTLQGTSDLAAARAQMFQIESALAQGLPFIPLYSGLTHEAYRGIRYPFDHILDGLGGVYGAPMLAIPAGR